MITDISHVITPGNFETTMTGIRQSIYDLPVLDNFLQSINRNLLTKIEALTITKKDQPASTTTASTNSNKSAVVVQKAGSTEAASNSCGARLNPVYTNFEALTKATTTPLSAEELRNAIVRNVADPVLQTIIFCICYVRTYQGNKFVGFNNNFATIELTEDYGARNNFFFPTSGIRQYICLDVKTTTSTKTNTQPIAIFSDVNKFIQFMRDGLQANVERILEPGMGLTKYYVCNWPRKTISETYYDQNKETEFKTVDETFEKALKLAKSPALGLSDVSKTGQIISVNPTITPTPTPTNGTVAGTGSQSTKIECTPTPTPSVTPPFKIPNEPVPQTETVKTEESQPQQTGPVTLIPTYVRNIGGVGGDERLTVIINPELKDWEIVPVFTEWNYQAVKTVVSNNQRTEVVVESRFNSRDLEDFVYQDKQGFSVDNFNILKLVEDDVDEEDFKLITAIYSNIRLGAMSKNKYTKFKETNNSKDVIPDSYQNFRFTVKLK
jgi:hypothetical protein